MASAVELPWELWPDGWAPALPLRRTLAMRQQGKGEASPRTYKDDSWRDKAPADLEEEGRWESQHHLDVLEVVPVPWRGGGVSGPGRTVWAWEAMEGWALTVDVHDGHTHDAGDDDQGEAGRVIVH